MRLILLHFLCEMDGQNSIIIVGGANMRGWTEKMSDDELEIVRNAGGVLLQREIPDSINIQVVNVRIKFLNLFDSNLDFIQGCFFLFR